MVPVTVIGSCRVYEPLAQSGLELRQKEVYGYTHNTCEHLQLIFLKSRGIPPSRDLSEVTLIPEKFNGFDGPPDDNRLFVIEVCSIRILEYAGWFLQLNRFFRFCERFQSMSMNAVKFTDEVTLKETLRLCENFPFDLSLLNYYEQAEIELFDDLRKIYRVVHGRVIFVPHFDTDHRGHSIWQRTRIHTCLDRLRREFGAYVFDPTPHVKEYGIDNALIDLGHYSKPFERRMVDILGGYVRDTMKLLT